MNKKKEQEKLVTYPISFKVRVGAGHAAVLLYEIYKLSTCTDPDVEKKDGNYCWFRLDNNHYWRENLGMSSTEYEGAKDILINLHLIEYEAPTAKGEEKWKIYEPVFNLVFPEYSV